MAEVEGEGVYVEGKGIVARHLYMYAAVWFFFYTIRTRQFSSCHKCKVIEGKKSLLFVSRIFCLFP